MSDYNREGRKRLSVDIPKELYLNIRALSGYKNCTITKFVIRALVDQIRKEKSRNSL